MYAISESQNKIFYDEKKYVESSPNVSAASIPVVHSYLASKGVTWLSGKEHCALDEFIPSYPKVVMLHKAGLKALAYKYSCKYSIHIHTSDAESLSAKFLQVKAKLPDQPVGILAHRNDCESHVVGMLFYYDSRENTGSVLVLDSIHYCSFGDNILDTLLQQDQKYLIENKHLFELNILHIDQLRQKDNFSCAPTALFTLRNALVHLKHLLSTQHISYLDFITSLNPDDNGYIKTIPVQWRCTDQIFSCSKEEEDELVAHDLFSNSFVKTMLPRTVSQFRAQHTETVAIHRTITFDVESLVLISYFPEIQLEETQQVARGFVQEKKINVYLLKKSRSFARYLDSLNDPEITKPEERRALIEQKVAAKRKEKNSLMDIVQNEDEN